MRAQPANLMISAEGRSGSGGAMIVNARTISGQAAHSSHLAFMPTIRQRSRSASGRFGAYSINSARVRSAQRRRSNAPGYGTRYSPHKRATLAAQESISTFEKQVRQCRTYPKWCGCQGGVNPILPQRPQVVQNDRSRRMVPALCASYCDALTATPFRLMSTAGPCPIRSREDESRVLQASISSRVSRRVSIIECEKIAFSISSSVSFIARASADVRKRTVDGEGW